MAKGKVIGIIVPPLTIVSVHGLIVYGFPEYTLSVFAMAAAAHFVLALTAGNAYRPAVLFASIAVLFLLLQVLALNGADSLVRVIAMPPVLIQGWLAWFFGRSLLPGREPLIRRFSRMHRNPFPAELEGYTYRLTVIWTVLLSTMTVLSAIIGLAANFETWSWLVNIAMPAVSAGFFLAEHGYRAVAYRHLGQNSPLTTLRTLTRPDTWITP